MLTPSCVSSATGNSIRCSAGTPVNVVDMKVPDARTPWPMKTVRASKAKNFMASDNESRYSERDERGIVRGLFQRHHRAVIFITLFVRLSRN